MADRRRFRRRAVAVLVVALLVLQLSALLVPRGADAPWPLRLFVRAVPALAGAVQGVGHAVGDAWAAWIANRDAARELQALRHRHEELRFAFAFTRLELDRRAALEQALGWTAEPWRGTVGRVVYHDPSDRDRIVWIDTEGGRDDLVGQAVIAGEALLGRIVRQNGDFGQVLLLRDVESAVDVVSESGVRGIVVGTGADAPRLAWVPRYEPLEPGELLRTTGRDAVFPAGWPVGVVTRIDRRPESLHLDAEVRLLAAIDGVDAVRTVPIAGAALEVGP